MKPIDLRSDTVSQPTPAMRAAMAAAVVGDDCYGDDPSVQQLEARVAELLGKQAGLFLPSGTMANQLAIATHTRPGRAIACVREAHIQVHEDASPARLSGVQAMGLGDRYGFGAEALEDLIREESCGWPRVELVCVENTLGLAGGRVWSQAELAEVRACAQHYERPIHLDGARLWNAHIASGEPLSKLAAIGDSVSVCLSKGLGCPAGTVLCGESTFIARARETRHAFGGALRQSGVLAAAGLHALEHHIERLAHDHRHAHQLWAALGETPHWSARAPETNMVIFELPERRDAERLCRPLREAGVLCYPNKYSEIRYVLHLGIDDAAVEQVITRTRAVLDALG